MHDDLSDERVAQLLGDDDITDVLIAGDFVAIGLRRAAMWQTRLDDLVTTVERLFWTPERVLADREGPSRDELVRYFEELDDKQQGDLHGSIAGCLLGDGFGQRDRRLASQVHFPVSGNNIFSHM